MLICAFTLLNSQPVLPAANKTLAPTSTAYLRELREVSHVVVSLFSPVFPYSFTISVSDHSFSPSQRVRIWMSSLLICLNSAMPSLFVGAYFWLSFCSYFLWWFCVSAWIFDLSPVWFPREQGEKKWNFENVFKLNALFTYSFLKTGALWMVDLWRFERVLVLNGMIWIHSFW